MALLDSLVVFVLSALVGGLGIYLGGQVMVGRGDYGHAIVTALVGAVVWGVVGFFLGWIPLLGPALTLLAYLLVVRLRYRAGWVEAAGITLIAWFTVVVVLYFAATLEVTSFEAVGVPGI